MLQRLWLSSALTMILVLPLSLLGAQTVPSSPIGRFHQVSSGIYRGARPSSEGLRFLASLGVRSILYLDNDPNQLKWETEEARKVGIKVIATPMSGFWKPKTKQVDHTLSILADRENHPIFVHCKHGRDRTGLITGLFRVEYQGWHPADAYQEMIDRGFRQSLFLLDYYYQQRTDWSPPPEDSESEF